MPLEKDIAACFVRQEGNCYYYHITPAFPAFNGHFENNPLLPAICQIGLCIDALSRHLQTPQEIAGISRAKFVRPILPDSTICLMLTPRPDGSFAAVLTSTDEEKFSQLIFTGKKR